jgi:hypothetical protein
MFKLFDQSRDVVEKTTPVNELIAIDRSIFTGTAAVGETNIRNFVHWNSASVSGTIFQSVYNSNYTSGTSVSLLNLTYGQSISSTFYTDANATNKTEKSKIYRLFAKYLLGDEDNLFSVSGTSKNELIFLSIARSQMKDELKKQSFTVNSTFSGSRTSKFNSRTFQDINAASIWTQGIRGDYANLYSGSVGGVIGGLIFYQAGIIALVPELFSNTSSQVSNVGNTWSGTLDYPTLVTSASFQDVINGCRNRFDSISFANQSNLQASYYFCRMQNDEFNYSSNPTFIDSSGRIITTSGSINYGPITYPTKIALYDENGDVMAVGCLNSPIRKDFSSEQIVVLRLDY